MVTPTFGLSCRVTVPTGGTPQTHLFDLWSYAIRAYVGGFQRLWMPDHLWYDGKPVLESVASLAALTVVLPHQVGHMVMNAGFRPAGATAKVATHMASMSPGYVLGLGRGWNEAEHHAMGIPFPMPVPAFCAYVDEVRDRMARCNPTGAVPVLVGGNGRAMVRAAAMLADGWNADGCPPGTFTERAKEALDVEPNLWLSWNGYVRPEGQCGGDRRFALGGAGGDQAVIDALCTMVSAGCSHFSLLFSDFPSDEGWMWFASRVMPAVIQSVS